MDLSWEMSQRPAGVHDLARSIGKGVIVTLLNDIGERYMSTRLWG